MARRKVSNLLALAVLATVVQRPMHRYEMASIMRARGKDRDMDIKWGSLYTVVDNLAKHGFLEIIGSSRAGSRPERTVYRITEAGRAELQDWTRELIATPVSARASFTAGLSVLAALSPSEAIELLDLRLDRLRSTDIALRAHLLEAAEVPRLFLVEDEYQLAMLAAEIAWVETLLTELRTGSHPDLALWQQWSSTGEMPAAVATLMERGSRPE